MDAPADHPSPRAPNPLPDFDRLWDYRDPAATERAFTALLPAAEAADDAAYLAALLSQLARSQGLQGRFDDADATLERAEAALDGAPASPEATTAGARIALERGRRLNSDGHPEEACPFFRDALALSERAGAEGFAIDAMHMLGIAAPAEEAMDWNRRALARARASDDPAARRWIGSLCNNLGWSLLEAGEAEAALAVFQEGAAWHQARVEAGEGSARRLGIARWTVARALRALGRTDEALALQRELEAEHEAGGREDGFVQEEIAECLWALGRRPEARERFARARALLADSYVPRAEPARWTRIEALARGDDEPR